ncbi:hypothetical protein L218DRAFT_1051034 [Marasmius fiardii PR-910]|nr:hypothetical protein L218DRAFT_1051034 [Marasmius fiardii PR-910]
MPDSDSEEDKDYIPPADDQPSSKRAKVTGTSSNPSEEDETTKKVARENAWKNFQNSLAPASADEVPSKKLVQIEKRHLFAGEEVVEIVKVFEDSEDAKKWPRWSPPDEENEKADPESSPSTVPSARRPGPRKSKTTLRPLPKPKKMSMLEKSAMDWRSHVGSQPESGLKDELEANRRGGGYLEKVEFLERVQERKEDVFEKNKGTKRRR